MNNADKPINAIVDMYGHAVDQNDFNAQSQKLTDKFSGLTKREHMAALMLQGILASGFQTTMEKNVESAIEHADELLKQLEK